MTLTAEMAAAQIQERLKSLYHLVKDIQGSREKSELNLTSITKAQEKAASDSKVSASHQQKLRGLYVSAAADAEQEESLLREALSKIYEIRSIRNDRRIQARNAGNKETIRRGALMKMLQISAQTLPLWVGKPGEKPPPLCGCTPPEQNHVSKAGDMVAALVKGPEGDENWILAEVVSYNTSGKYEVDDIDEEQKDRHVLSKRRVMPLPLMRANPDTDPNCLFPKSSIVMALYPQTTCFYKAIINRLPVSSMDEYEVLFEDATYPDGYSPPLTVAQRYVIAAKEKKGK
ncbi:SAGA-associated factor 29 [Cloeon dipterum]|uniref:SAGA-associated factor 29 n=1 Tax=Cloeon dipterum TaxID=197152 RepID=UPI00321FC1E8